MTLYRVKANVRKINRRGKPTVGFLKQPWYYQTHSRELGSGAKGAMKFKTREEAEAVAATYRAEPEKYTHVEVF